MVRRAFFVVAAVCAVQIAAALRTATVSVEYVFVPSADMSLTEAREKALERAKIKAVEDEFGTYVSQFNTTVIDNVDGSGSMQFLSYGGSELKGEWIETIGTPEYELVSDGTELAVKVKVRGKVREIKDNRVPTDVKIFRNGFDPGNETVQFVAGDSFYMSFASPANGFLAVYLVDQDERAYCLVPYQAQQDGTFPIKANHCHLLFSRAEKEESATFADELIMDTPLEEERNRIFTIFSPNKFFKAVDKATDADLPRNLSFGQLDSWIAQIRKNDPQLSVSISSITIKRR